MYEPYTQAERDRAVGIGCLALVIGTIVGVATIVAVMIVAL